MNVLAYLLTALSCVYAKSITITWSTPDQQSIPLTHRQSLKAIQTHLQALQLAQSLPSILKTRNSLQIKLCPPQPYDPLVKEFTVPRLARYTAVYDHECINSDTVVEVKWGWKPKQPETPTTPPPADRFKGVKGLTVPAFILELIKTKNEDNTNAKQVWMLDSDSLRNWLTAPILSYIQQERKRSIPASQLMSQINTMYGTLGEKDLKNMPQAIQGALVLVLPDYSAWNTNGIKTLFNPTWWMTRFVTRSPESITKLLKTSITKSRIDNQLIIIHHDPTPFNFNIVNALALHYGEKNLISSTRVLPKTATTLQLLQFIQKAAGIVVDSRDLLGQVVLLSTGFSSSVTQFQNHLPYSTPELILITFLAIWFIAVLATRIYYTQKHYSVSLHEHAKRVFLFSILAIAPIYGVFPSWWPASVSIGVFSLIEAGYELVLYSIGGFYLFALVLTALMLVYKKYKNINSVSDSFDEESAESDSEEIHLVPK